MERQQAIDELKRVASLLEKSTLSRREFNRHAHFSSSAVERTFGSWNRAVEAAGLSPNTSNTRLSDEELQREFRRVVDALAKTPTRSEFFAEGKHSASIYEQRFGGWRKVVAHYLGPEMVTTPPRARPLKPASVPARGAQRGVAAPTAAVAGKAERLFGAPLDFRGLRHEPLTEQGVVFLFGMVAHELGFLVEAVGTGYPDCKAKRLHKGRNYVEARIEFEFKSSNFREHGHDPAACDLIVCWEHDWEDCPVEVLELKSATKGLA
jgi:hypothetical protein